MSVDPTDELRERVRRRIRVSGASGEVAAIAADALIADELAPLLAELRAPRDAERDLIRRANQRAEDDERAAGWRDAAIELSRAMSPVPLSRTPGRHPLCRCGHTRASHGARNRMCYGGSTCGCAEYRPRPVEQQAPR